MIVLADNGRNVILNKIIKEIRKLILVSSNQLKLFILLLFIYNKGQANDKSEELLLYCFLAA